MRGKSGRGSNLKGGAKQKQAETPVFVCKPSIILMREERDAVPMQI